MQRYEGKRVVVTGGASGIGAAIALSMAAEGAAVAVLDLDEAGARVVADKAGGPSLAVRCDVADPDDVARAFAAVDAALGGLDVLVNNAGHAPPQDEAKTQRALANLAKVMAGQAPDPLRGTSSLELEAWDRMIRVHLYGTFYCAREGMRRMEEAGRGGAMLNITSILGLAGSAQAPHYSAAKGGIIALTKSLSQDGMAAGIRVNAIAPGWIDTPLTQNALAPEMAAVLKMQIPMGRMGTVEEIAPLALHLCADEASYTTGQIISPNGGVL
jgi:3-oxoacyl-[acyl-carrier protein] reductase